MNKFLKSIVAGLLIVIVSSCANYKDVPYFQNAKGFKDAGTNGLYDMTIKPKDMLSIFVFSSQKEAVMQFNTRDPQPLEITSNRITTYGYPRVHHYLVDNNGDIDFPVVGKINIGGLTIEQTNQRIKEKIAPYIQKGTDYLVNTTIDNFEVTVMGE